MFAKLVVSTAPTIAKAMRDIVRLVTSQSPNVANLEGFSQTSSVIIDSTPAGWTYQVGTECYLANSAPIQIRYTSANTTGPEIGATVNTANVIEQHTISAPCLSPLDGLLKYTALTSYSNCACTATSVTSGFGNFFITGAANVNTSTGVLTGESYRQYHSGGGAGAGGNFIGSPAAGQTFYLIANQRHITLVRANAGYFATWETSQSEADLFYQSAPFVQSYVYNLSDVASPASTFSTAPAASAGGENNGAFVFNHTIPSTGALSNCRAVDTINPFLFPWQQSANSNPVTGGTKPKTSGVDSNGLTRHFATPILFHSMKDGIPIKFVTGVVPLYFMNGGIGTTGDTVTINGVSYTYVDVITNNAGVRVAIQPMGFAALTN